MRRIITLGLIGSLCLPVFAHDKPYDHQHVQINQTSTQHSGEPPVIIQSKGIIDAKRDAVQEAKKFALSATGTLAAIGVGAGTGLLGMAFLTALSKGESVPLDIRLRQKNETDEYKIVFMDTYGKETKRKKQTQRLAASSAGLLVTISFFLMSSSR